MTAGPSENKRPAVVIVPFVQNKQHKDKSYYNSYELRSDESVVEEAVGLAEAISLDIVHTEIVNIKNINASTFFGKGQFENMRLAIAELQPDVVIVNHTLSPVQQRNLEKKWNVKVIDRTALILEIFGERAQTKEGKLQVELATCHYQKSRLVRTWTHLERQRGSLGFIGGPGETQLEIDKRLIGEQIKKLEKDLDKVKQTRELQNKRRQRQEIPVISLVGYTNAGKSTLFNRVADEKIFAKDLLFATLDPTARKFTLGKNRTAVITDTVGFISDLPTDLIAAFQATLEQIQFADVIVHVRDISSHDTEAQAQDVKDVLDGLGIKYEDDNRIVEVWNKIDNLDEVDQKYWVRKASGPRETPAVAMSAVEGVGIDMFLETVQDVLNRNIARKDVVLPVSAGEALSWLYAHAKIIKKQVEDMNIHVTIDITPDNFNRFCSKFPDFQDV